MLWIWYIKRKWNKKKTVDWCRQRFLSVILMQQQNEHFISNKLKLILCLQRHLCLDRNMLRGLSMSLLGRLVKKIEQQVSPLWTDSGCRIFIYVTLWFWVSTSGLFRYWWFKNKKTSNIFWIRAVFEQPVFHQIRTELLNEKAAIKEWIQNRMNSIKRKFHHLLHSTEAHHRVFNSNRKWLNPINYYY